MNMLVELKMKKANALKNKIELIEAQEIKDENTETELLLLRALLIKEYSELRDYFDKCALLRKIEIVESN